MEESSIKDCNAVVFSNRAYNSIIRESFKKDPVETGGILLGHIVDDTWVVMEVLPPGIHCIFEIAYFEYDEDFVNYLADSVANQYKIPLELLGLWHRHPGSMDTFSGTDDITNTTFAKLHPKGAISGLVNIDPKFRFTMYHLGNPDMSRFSRPCYQQVEIEVGDDIIPRDFFELRYINSVSFNLHPIPFGKNKSEQPNVLPVKNGILHKDTHNSENNKKICSLLWRYRSNICSFLLGIASVFLFKGCINTTIDVYNNIKEKTGYVFSKNYSDEKKKDIILQPIKPSIPTKNTPQKHQQVKKTKNEDSPIKTLRENKLQSKKNNRNQQKNGKENRE